MCACCNPKERHPQLRTCTHGPRMLALGGMREGKRQNSRGVVQSVVDNATRAGGLQGAFKKLSHLPILGGLREVKNGLHCCALPRATRGSVNKVQRAWNMQWPGAGPARGVKQHPACYRAGGKEGGKSLQVASGGAKGGGKEGRAERHLGKGAFLLLAPQLRA